MMKPKLFELCAVLFFVFVACTAFGSNVCIDAQSLSYPNLKTSVQLINFYEKSWEKLLGKLIKNQYGSDSTIFNLINRVYEKSGSGLIFFKNDFSPRSSVNVLLNSVEKLHSLEDKKFPELQAVLTGLKYIDGFLSKKPLVPEEIVRNKFKFCLSRSVFEKVYIGGLLDSPDMASRFQKWASHQIEQQISFAKTIIKTDIRLSGMFLRYTMYINPFYLEKLDIGAYSENGEKMSSYLEMLHPKNCHYIALVRHLSFYKDISSLDQIKIEDKVSFRAGMSGASILDLQKRLNQEGYLPKDAITGVFDTNTEQAVKLFQKTHFLKEDGVVGPKTRGKLNIPFKLKYEWIKLSLDALRSCSFRVLDRFIWVNIPTFSLEYHSNGKLVSVHKVIVGKAGGSSISIRGRKIRRNNTLPMISEIKSLVFNPRWYVPERIRKELEKDLEKDPDYLKKEGFRPLKSSVYSWGEPRIYQLPGETNPMGKVKFIFDNPFGIFLHDTSQPRLFKKPYRAFSHGCVRVEKALELAKLILKDVKPEVLGNIKKYLSKRDQTYIVLKHPVPIFITYIPVLSDKSGKLLFGGDPYNWIKNGKLPGFFYIK